MLNAVILMGRLTADPELRHTSTNNDVTSFTVAVERNFRSGTERKTDFIDVVAWNKAAEFICKWFKKGQPIIIEGSLQTHTYEDQNGNKRKVTEVITSQVNFAGGRNETEAPAKTQESTYDPSLPFAGDPNGPLPGSKEFKEARQTELEPLPAVDDDDLPF